MKNIMGLIILTAVFAEYAAAQSPSAAELLKRVDDNEVYSTIYYEGEMIIEYQGKRFVKTMKAWARATMTALLNLQMLRTRGLSI